MYLSGDLGKNQHLGILKTFEITLALLGVISKVFEIPRFDFSQITLKNMRLLLLIYMGNMKKINKELLTYNCYTVFHATQSSGNLMY